MNSLRKNLILKLNKCGLDLIKRRCKYFKNWYIYDKNNFYVSRKIEFYNVL